MCVYYPFKVKLRNVTVNCYAAKGLNYKLSHNTALLFEFAFLESRFLLLLCRQGLISHLVRRCPAVHGGWIDLGRE